MAGRAPRYERAYLARLLLEQAVYNTGMANPAFDELRQGLAQFELAAKCALASLALEIAPVVASFSASMRSHFAKNEEAISRMIASLPPLPVRLR